MEKERERHYLVPAQTARDAGVAGSRYRTADGRYLVNGHDLARAGITCVGDAEAAELVRANGYVLGEAAATPEGDGAEAAVEASAESAPASPGEDEGDDDE